MASITGGNIFVGCKKENRSMQNLTPEEYFVRHYRMTEEQARAQAIPFRARVLFWREYGPLSGGYYQG